MKFEILQEQLSKSLGIVAHAVANRPQLPVLSNILIEARAEGLLMSATDLELGITTQVPAKVIAEGVVSVPSRIFLDFVGSLPPGKVQCELVKEALVVTAGGFRGRVQTIAAEEFPALPKVDHKPMAELAIEDLRAGIERVIFATAKDVLRPVLTGVLISWQKKGMKLVATDGFRLSLTRVVAIGTGWSSQVLVPARAMSEVARLSTEGRVGIVIHEKTNQIVFSLGETMVVSQLLSGNYPEYGKIIPSEFEGVVEVNREELLSALRAVHIFARDNSNVVKWVVGDEGIELLAETPEKGEAKAEVAGKLDGEGGEIVFNAKFVLDYLTNSKADSITLSMGGSLKPGMLQEAAAKGSAGDKDSLYIVMPINV